ncbi:hypothetical protein FHL15_001259 [Xylaria flabelliformis]|uniref:DUF676 domain-containing protein n=1 Tax=Xylaria flabelliformis TaxID=2512241 RepID=A0A553ICZ4_9PEZI|nr:hypothetical protein FHL15_001259 [Xylaria flabelliformis]
MRRSSSLFKSLQRVHLRSSSVTTPVGEANNSDEGAALTEVYRGENPEIDIVAVHGINGDAFSTFSAKSNNRFWLGDPDMLPRDVKNSRIMTYRYPASVATMLGGTSSDRILQHAQTMIAELVADRELEDATERPIIFVCHSLGGIIVKRQALVYSASRTGRHINHLHSIYVSTYGILFFGTPHQGSGTANLATFAQRIVDVLLPSKLDLRVYFFWEQDKTDLGYKFDYVVTETSAAPILDNTDRAGLRADHRGMCRFVSRNAPGYKLVASSLLRYSRDAPRAISRRWRIEKDMLRSLRQQELRNLREEDEIEDKSEAQTIKAES